MRERRKRGDRTWTATFQALSRLALALATLALIACVTNAWRQRAHPVGLLTPLALLDRVTEEPRVLPAAPRTSPDGSLQLAIEVEDESDDLAQGGAAARVPTEAPRSDKVRSPRDPSRPSARERPSSRPSSNLEPGLPRGPPPA